MKPQKLKLAFLLTHPIQYVSPLLKRIASEPDIDLVVFYQSNFSIRKYYDKGFGCKISWDSPLLEGHAYRFLPSIGRKDLLTYFRPVSYGFWRNLNASKFDAIIIHGYNRPFHWLVILQARILGVKIFIRDDATLFSKKRGLIKRVFKRTFFAILNFMVEGFLAIGTANADYYLHNGVPEHKVFKAPYSVDNDYFRFNAKKASLRKNRFRNQLNLENARPIVLYVSKLQKRKRPLDLFDAFIEASKSLSPIPYLLYIGEGEMKKLLLKRIESHGKDLVRYLGFRNQSELPAFYALCDVFVLPSIDEPWGLVVNEVMNAGKAVVVSDQVGSGIDLVKNGQNGYVIPAGNISALSDSLIKILSDPFKCKQMGERSAELIERWGYQESIKGIRKALGVSKTPIHEQEINI